MTKIKDSAKVRVCVAGVCLQTTAGMLRKSAISTVLFYAWLGFETEHLETGITGKAGRYLDTHTGKSVDIQFDLY